MANQYYRMHYSNTTYLPEKYARQMARRRFVGGMVVGAVIMYASPLYKACREVCKTALKSWHKKHDPEYTEVEETDITEEDFAYPFSEQVEK